MSVLRLINRRVEIDHLRWQNRHVQLEQDLPVAPRAEDIVYCREVLAAGRKLMGARRWAAFIDAANTAKGSPSPISRATLSRGRAMMREWARRAA